MQRTRVVEAVAALLRSSNEQALLTIRAVLSTLRDGMSDDEAREVAVRLPDELRELWPVRGEGPPELAEMGGEGVLGRVRVRLGIDSDSEAGHAISAVLSVLMNRLGVVREGGVWQGLQHLDRESKMFWMRVLRSANFPVELLIQRP